MWLLRLHVSISTLCLLTFIGFKSVFKDLIIKNGYELSEKKNIWAYWIFIVPILNVLTVVVLFTMITIKKDEISGEDEKEESIFNGEENSTNR